MRYFFALVFNDDFKDEQRFEQYLTFSQSRSHFLRQVNGRSQTGHTFVGKLDFFIFRQLC